MKVRYALAAEKMITQSAHIHCLRTPYNLTLDVMCHHLNAEHGSSLLFLNVILGITANKMR